MIEKFRRQAKLTRRELWQRFYALGGNATEAQVKEFLAGTSALGRPEYDRLAQALNERFAELDQDTRVPYFEDLGRTLLKQEQKKARRQRRKRKAKKYAQRKAHRQRREKRQEAHAREQRNAQTVTTKTSTTTLTTKTKKRKKVSPTS